MQEFLQAIYDAGDIELGTYEGLYCVSCEAYYTEDELVDGNCPIHGRPVEHVTEENYFFKLSRYEDRLLEYYAAHPEAVQPESRRNEVLGFIRGGLQDFSMSRTSITWGVPLPWDPKHVAYVWVDALFNYCTAVGYGTDDAALREVVARRLPPHRQGHPPLPRRVLARDVDVGRARAAEVRVRARLAARRRREDEQDAGSTRSRRPISSPTSASTASATTSWPTSASVPTATSPTRRWSQRYNADLANNFGNLARRVLNMAVSYCGGVGPAPRPTARSRDAAAPAFDGMPPQRGSACSRPTRSARSGT